jgi:hypothetical protein
MKIVSAPSVFVGAQDVDVELLFGVQLAQDNNTNPKTKMNSGIHFLILSSSEQSRTLNSLYGKIVE